MKRAKSQFKITFSTISFNKNNIKNYVSNLEFEKGNYSIKEIENKLKLGFCYTSNLDLDKWRYKGTDKTKRFKNTFIVSLDLDNIKSNINITELENNISKFKPTLIYTSTNHQIKKESETKSYSRFRLLYIFDSPITSKLIYNSIQKEIENNINKEIFDNSKSIDKCHYDITKFYCGNSGSNYESKINDIIYNISDFSIKETEDLPFNQIDTTPKKIPTIIKVIDLIDKSVLNDFLKMDYRDFLFAHQLKYNIIIEEEVKFNKQGYALSNFPTLKRYSRKSDGNQRRKHLWKWAIFRKAVKPKITIEEQLFNIVGDIVNYIDNSDGVITKNEVLNNILLSAIKYEPNFNFNRKWLRVDKEYCRVHNIDLATYQKQIKSNMRKELVLRYYNNSKSLRENLKLIKELNLTLPTGEEIKLSINSLRKYINNCGK